MVRPANTQIDFFGNPKPNKTGRKPGFELEISLKSPWNWGACTKVSGTKMVGHQDMENCLLLVRMVALFVASGRKESWRVMANLFQPVEVAIRVSGLLVWNRVKGPSPGPMVWNLKAASTKMQLLRGLYACPQGWWDAWCRCRCLFGASFLALQGRRPVSPRSCENKKEPPLKRTMSHGSAELARIVDASLGPWHSSQYQGDL